MNPSTYSVMVKTSMSFSSWGEDIMISVAPGVNGNCNVMISSSLKFGLVDWGKNKSNIMKIINLLIIELQQYGLPNQPEQTAHQ